MLDELALIARDAYKALNNPVEFLQLDSWLNLNDDVESLTTL